MQLLEWASWLMSIASRPQNQVAWFYRTGSTKTRLMASMKHQTSGSFRIALKHDALLHLEETPALFKLDLTPAPHPFHHQLKPRHAPSSLHRCGVFVHLRLLSRPIHRHPPRLRLNQPSKFSPVRDPFVHHLLFHVLDPVARRRKLDHKLGTQRRIALLFGLRQRSPFTFADPRRVGRTNGTARQFESRAGIESQSTPVFASPDRKGLKNPAVDQSSLATRRRHDEYLPTRFPLHAEGIVFSAEPHKLQVAHRRLGSQANRQLQR